MASSKWVYLLSTGQFLRGGFYDVQYDPVVEGTVTFDDVDPNPDQRLQRFDPALGKRAATTAEVAAYDAATVDATAKSDVASRATKVTVVWILKRLLGRNPTAIEIDTAKAEWIAISKALG